MIAFELSKKDKILLTLRKCLRNAVIEQGVVGGKGPISDNVDDEVNSLRDTILFIETKFQEGEIK